MFPVCVHFLTNYDIGERKQQNERKKLEENQLFKRSSVNTRLLLGLLNTGMVARFESIKVANINAA